MSKSDFGKWINPEKGYSLVKQYSRPEEPLYIFTLNLEAPLMFRRANGTLIEPDGHFRTDMGSVPKSLQRWFPKDEFLLSYILHDSGCIHKGNWVQGADGNFHFVFMSRKEIDDLLYDGIRAEGGSSWKAYSVWLAVRFYAIMAGK